MSELWVPRPEKTAGNFSLFDIMYFMQEGLEKIEGREKKIAWAKFSVVSLARQLREISERGLDTELVTDVAALRADQESDKVDIVSNVGILGTVKDISCISQGEEIPLSYSLEVSVVKAFSIPNTDEASFAHDVAYVPIKGVRYIETLAS